MKSYSPLDLIRKRNLKLLLADYSATTIASQCGWSGPSRVSQLISEDASRDKLVSITEKTARKIEKSMGLEHRWMDQERDEYGRLSPEDLPKSLPLVQKRGFNTNTEVIDVDRFTTVTSAVTECVKKYKLSLSLEKLTAIAKLAYEIDTHDGDELTDLVDGLVRIAK